MRVALHHGEGIGVADGTQFDLLGAIPRRGHGDGERVVADPAVLDGDEIMRARPAQTQSSLVIDRAAKSSPSSRPVTGNAFDAHVVLNAANSLASLTNDGSLP